MRPMILLLAPLLLANAPQTAAPEMKPMAMATPASCPTPAAALPAALAGWSDVVPRTAATDAKDMTGASIPLAKRADLQLAPASSVKFAAAPGKAPAPDTFAGMVSFTVVKAGSYRVALGAGAWIDMLRDGSQVRSSAHDHGPACSGVRKTVDFALTPGNYVLQISGNKDAVSAVMVAPLP